MFFRGELTTVNDNDYSSPANDLPWLMRVNYKNTEPNFVYNIVYTITPTLVNEFNIGTAGWSEHQLYASFGAGAGDAESERIRPAFALRRRQPTQSLSPGEL